MGRTGRTTDDDDDGPSVGLDQRWKKGGEINSEERRTSPSFEQGEFRRDPKSRMTLQSCVSFTLICGAKLEYKHKMGKFIKWSTD